MFFLPVLTAIFAILFFAVLPISGALFVRSTWHVFRKTLISAESLPVLTKKEILNTACTEYPCRAYGIIDAIGTDESVWVSIDGASIKVFLENVPIYLLSGSRRYGRARNRKEEFSVERYLWKSMPSIPVGNSVFITGIFTHIDGMPVFLQREDSKPIILIHDVPQQYVIYLAVFAGRPVNEYWNPFTKVSLALGLFAMTGIIIGVMSIKFISLIAAISLTLAFSPILPFLPPGIAGFALYRRFWRRARYFRARRDVTLLRTSSQMLYGKPSKKDIMYWKRLALINLLLSGFFFIAGYIVNAILVFVLLRSLL